MSVQELVITVRKMLWEDWDPIGVNQFPEASDEYDSYAPGVVELVQHQASEQEILDWLWSLETGHIGLEGDRENTEQFAAKLRKFAEQFNASPPIA